MEIVHFPRHTEGEGYIKRVGAKIVMRSVVWICVCGGGGVPVEIVHFPWEGSRGH